MREFKDQEQEESEDEFDAGFTIPNTKQVLGSIQDALRAEHEQLMEEEDKEDKSKGKNKQRQRKGGVICCCGNPHCGIGPMRPTAGE